MGTGIACGPQTFIPARRKPAVIIIGKLIKVAVWMLSMPFRVEVMHVQSTSTAAEDSEKSMVPHMPNSAAQCCAFETTFCSGALNSQ